jgi:GH24 family phage-related lysozyme (muramidase)
MYVDTVGKVTVGIGHNLTAHADLLSLNFVVKRLTRKKVKGGATGTPVGDPKKIGRGATADEKKNDYNFLRENTGLGKYGPHQLAEYTTLEMSGDDILKLFEKDLQEAISIARSTFKEFDKFPVPAQAALIDISFNTGSFRTFHRFSKAIKGEGEYAGKSWADRWKTAADHSRRGAVNAARNTEIANWLKEAAK